MKMNKARINKDLTQRQLSLLTKISILRLNYIENEEICPSNKEKNKIISVLGECDFVDKQTAKKNRKAMNKISNAIVKAFEFIKINKEMSGKIICPLCGKELTYQKHSNGHIWGKCETKNCLNWVQ
ncbi:MAG: hypothetical protein ACFFG0_02270 [Candidatus Thorarchaeota archaeon]